MSEKFVPTPEQSAAINFPRTRPAVVSAAAGSGKTTLLVERIIKLISDMENPVDAGSLTVMTFTVNATNSLRDKLNSALQSEISRLSESSLPDCDRRKKFLSEQMISLRSASISTINAFCLGIIRENVQEFDLPVNFSIADETKKTSMQMSAARLAAQDFYDDGDGAKFSDEERKTLFFTFNFENDNALFDAIMQTAEKQSSFYGFDKWLCEAENAYSDIKNLEKIYIDIYVDYVGKQLKIQKYFLKKMRDLRNSYESELNSNFDDAKRKKQITALETLDESLDFDCKRFDCLCKEYDKFRAKPSVELLDGLLKKALECPENTVTVSRLDPQNTFKKQFNATRKAFSEAYSRICEINFDLSEEVLTLPEQRVAAQSFIMLIRLYNQYYSEIKRTQGCIDFSDCELLLLDRLKKDEAFRSLLSQRFSCVIVDEFQDSNDVQAEIFELIGGQNLFYVGDIKQSIYAFRGGNPSIMARLCKGDGGFTELLLNRNFRSRREIIDTVNYTFSNLMTEEYGGVDYAGKNALECGASYPDCAKNNIYDTEIFALDFGKNDDESDMRSARFVAKKIKELMDDEDFFITKNGVLTRPSYSDFAILLRNNGKIKLYREALSELEIMSVAPKGRNFLLSEEIVLLTNFLKIIDNPLRNEETLNVLMSPLYGFSAEEIASLKLGTLGLPVKKIEKKALDAIAKCVKKYSLFGCMNFCARSPEERQNYAASDFARLANEAEIELNKLGIFREKNEKVTGFLRDCENFRFFMSNNSLDSLIRKIFDETDIFAVVSAFDDSRQRVSNIRRLENIAAEFEAREGGSLSDFLRFIEKSAQKNRDIEEASAPEDAANSVKIMTFHGSKGLEIPICILAELDCKMNLRDASGSFLYSHDHYFSMDFVDRKNRFREKTFSSEALKIINRKKPVGEELRLLYVAMTRAMEKLILVGKFSGKQVDEMCEDRSPLEKIFDGAVPFKWLLDKLCKCFTSEITRDNCRVKLSDNLPCSLTITTTAPEAPEILLCDKTHYEIPKSEVKNLCDKISAEYPNAAETRRQAKFSVTELARHDAKIPFRLTRPAFAREEKSEGTDVGNAYHKCLENVSIVALRACEEADISEKIAAEIDRICDCKKISDEEAALLDAEKIARFFKSDIGRRMLASPRVEREFPFYSEVDCSDIFVGIEGEAAVQGRVDMFFFEENGIVVVDYKTDSDINSEKIYYERQMKIYAKVLPKLFGKPVRACCLYLFSKGEIIYL